MRIDLGRGTPIHVGPRKAGGVTLAQGRSHLVVSAEEIPLLLRALREVGGVEVGMVTTPAKARIERYPVGEK